MHRRRRMLWRWVRSNRGVRRGAEPRETPAKLRDVTPGTPRGDTRRLPMISPLQAPGPGEAASQTNGRGGNVHTSLAGSGAVPTRTQLADATRNRQTHGGRRLGRRGGRGRQTPLGHGVGGATQVPLLADAAQGQQVGLAGCDWPGPAFNKLEPDVAPRRGLGVGTSGPHARKPTGSLKRVRSSARNELAQVPGRRQLDTNAKAVRRRSPPTRQAGLRRPAGRMGQGQPRPVLDKLEPNASSLPSLPTGALCVTGSRTCGADASSTPLQQLLPWCV